MYTSVRTQFQLPSSVSLVHCTWRPSSHRLLHHVSAGPSISHIQKPFHLKHSHNITQRQHIIYTYIHIYTLVFFSSESTYNIIFSTITSRRSLRRHHHQEYKCVTSKRVNSWFAHIAYTKKIILSFLLTYTNSYFVPVPTGKWITQQSCASCLSWALS